MLYLARPSMQLEGLGERSASGFGQSPAAKRHLVYFWSANALSGKALNAARSALSSARVSGRSPAAK